MRLTRRLTLTLLVGVAVLFAAESWVDVDRFRQFYQADVRRDLHLIGDILRVEAEAAWSRGGEERVRALVQEAEERDPTIEIRWVTPEQGMRSPSRSLLAPLFAGELSEVSIEWAPEERPGEPGRSTYVPVHVGGSLVGAVEVSERVGSADRYIQAELLRKMGIGLAMLGLSGALAWLAGRSLVGRPVEELIQKARRIGNGDFTPRAAISARNELAELSASMDDMARALAASRQRANEETQARLRAVEQLRHADRLTTLGTLAAGLAHELGTPLGVVSGRAQMLEKGYADTPADVADMARTIRAQADRMAVMVRALLDFARRPSEAKVDVNLHEQARKALDMLTPLASKQRVRLVLESPFDPGAIALADPAQFEQVVTNLVVNAIQVSPEGGCVRVRVARVEAAPRKSGATSWACVVLAVSDQGPGIPPEALPQVFDPFFTTKPVGEGTGLGLAVVHGIVEEHKGWIEVESRSGGTTLSVFLPQGISPEGSASLAVDASTTKKKEAS